MEVWYNVEKCRMGELVMVYKRLIKFQYYRIFYQKINGGNLGELELFDFENWLIFLKEEDLLQKSIEFYETKARIEKITYDAKTELSGIRLMRLTDTNIPYKVKDDCEAEVIHLDDDEYIGKDIMLLFDRKSNILMIQSNQFSLNISKICEFIKFTRKLADVNIVIEPILDNASERLKMGSYRKFDISFANILNLSEARLGKTSLNELLHPLRDMGGVTAKISISLGHSKLETLNRGRMQNLFSEICNNEKYIRSAKVKVKADDEREAEVVDLFDNIANDYIEFSLQSREVLSYEVAFSNMCSRFLKRRKELYRVLKIEEG